MKIENWDRQILEISESMKKIKKSYRKIAHSEKQSLVRKKLTIVKYQNELEKLVEELDRFQKMNLPVAPRLKSIIDWSAEIGKNGLAYYKKKSRYLGQGMWLSLIKSRLNGGNPDAGYLIEDHDVIKMAEYQKDMRETRRFVRSQLEALEEERENLMLEYQHYSTTTSNKEAAASFQKKLGCSFESSMDQSTMKAFSTYISRLTAPMRNSTPKEHEMQVLQKSYRNQTKDFLSMCKEYIFTSRGSARLVLGATARQQLSESLDKIYETEQRLKYTSETVSQMVPPDPRPILVKKSGNQGKRA